MDKQKTIIIALGSFTLLALLAFVVFFFVLPSMRNDTGNAPVDPFGGSGEDRPGGLVTNDTDPSDDGTDPSQMKQTEIELKDGSMLRRIVAEPVAGAIPYLSDGELMVRYLVRNSGDVFDTSIDRTTSPTLLYDAEIDRGVAYALWSPTASTTITLSLSTNNENVFSYIRSFTSAVAGSSTPASPNELTVTGRIGLTDPLSTAFSPDGTMFAVLVAEEKGSVLYIERVDSGTRRQVWSSPLRGLTLRWVSPKSITVYTNPDDDLTGAAWAVDPATGSSQLLLSNKFGLSVLPHVNEKFILYSQHTEAGTYSLRVFQTDGKDDTYLSSPTLAEKCVWGSVARDYVYCAIPRNINRAGFIGAWYRGEFSSSDTLWRYDAKTGAGKRLLDPEEVAGVSIDMVDLAVDPTDSYLLFRDRLNGHLWSLELPNDITANTESASSTPGF